MAFPLDTTFCLIAAVPAVIAIAQGKDGATRAWCGALLLVALAIGLRHWIGPLDRVLNGAAIQGLAIATGVLSVVCAVRAGNAILSTLMVTGSVLLAANKLGLIG